MLPTLKRPRQPGRRPFPTVWDELDSYNLVVHNACGERPSPVGGCIAGDGVGHTPSLVRVNLSRDFLVLTDSYLHRTAYGNITYLVGKPFVRVGQTTTIYQNSR